MTRQLLVLVLLTWACGEKDSTELTRDDGASTSAAELPSLTAEALYGSWAGPFGDLHFDRNGTARLHFRSCPDDRLEYLERRPTAETLEDCSLKDISGAFKIARGRFVTVAWIREEGMSFDQMFLAFLSDSGRLHLESATVLDPLTPARTGRVRLNRAAISDSWLLEVGDGTCTYVNTPIERRHTAPCQWTKRGDVDVLSYEVDDGFDAGNPRTQHLVYDSRIGHIMSPALAFTTFERVDEPAP